MHAPQQKSSPLAQASAFTGAAMAAIGGALMIYGDALVSILKFQIYCAVILALPHYHNWLSWFPKPWLLWLSTHSEIVENLPLLGVCLLMTGTLVLALSLFAMFRKTPQ